MVTYKIWVSDTATFAADEACSYACYEAKVYRVEGPRNFTCIGRFSYPNRATAVALAVSEARANRYLASQSIAMVTNQGDVYV